MNLSHDTKRKLLGFTFLIPYLLGFLMFFAVPLGQTVYYSFQKIDVPPEGGMSFTFLGMKNYLDLFTTELSTVNTNTQILRVLMDENTNMLINMPLITLLSLFLALLANRQFKGRAVVRMIFFLPIILGLDVVTEMLTISTGGETVQSAGLFAEGLVARLLFRYTAIPPQYLNPIIDFVENIFSVIARSGVQTLVFLAALQSISPSMYEVARIEGATGYETFWKVTFPMVMPHIITNTIYTIVDAFSQSEVVNLAYTTAFTEGNYGLSSAFSVISSVITCALLALVVWLMSKRTFYYN